MHHCAPPSLTDLIPNHVRDIYVVDHNLQNKDDLRNNCPRTEKYKHSIFMDGIMLRNNLPDGIKDLDSFDSFCDKIKALAFSRMNCTMALTCTVKNAVQQFKLSFV